VNASATISRAKSAPSGRGADDKLRILAAIKKIRGRRVATAFVRQGHYALDAGILAVSPAPDASIKRIGDLLGHEVAIVPPQAATVSCIRCSTYPFIRRPNR
jgi:hypothetical protein